ncbi:TonB-dependent siderophore receptor [Billgrantia azerbaijanica]|nr:TonB-dependent siderophore receptor [Halomonas azerbaijanica]
MPSSSRCPAVQPLTTAVRRAIGLSMSSVLLTVPLVGHAQDDILETDTLVVVGTALKVAAPLVETPRPVSLVEREELEERNVQRLDEAFRYRAGVLSGHYGADNDTDWLKVRGFDHSTYQDGLRIYREGFFQWLPEPYGLESVEVFKGPSSILYGEAPPGGLINAISKRPTEVRRGRVDLQVGNRDHRLLGGDVSGPLTADGDVRYRLVGLAKARDGDLDHTENERYYLAPSLAIDLGDDTTLTLLASVQKDDGVPTNPFKLPYGTVQDTPFGRVARSANFSEPDYDVNERTQSALGYELQHRLNDTWSFEQDLRYSQLDLELRSTYALFMLDGRLAARGHIHRDGEIDSWTVDNRLIGRWFTDRTENTLLLGLDHQDLELRAKEADPFPFGDPIDIFDPQYGNFTPVEESELIDRHIDKRQTGLYVQDQLRLDDRWVFLGGVRFDQAKTDNANRTSGVTQRSDDDQLSWSGGLMYLGDNGLNPYLSYTESFDPLGRVDDQGRLYEPREGKQWEAGIKFAPSGWDGYVTAALFDLEESNTLVTSPAGFQVQEGERRSRGFEIESVGYLTDNLQLTAAYAYTDARLEDDERAALIPRHQAATWLDYAFTGGVLRGLKLGGGLRYVGETVDGDIGVPHYTLVDAMASYDFAEDWRVQLNVNNLTDKEYVASCDYWCYYGESRSVIGSLSYRW